MVSHIITRARCEREKLTCEVYCLQPLNLSAVDCTSAWYAAINAAQGGLGNMVSGHRMMMDAFFLEPMLTMVISHWQDHGSVASARVCIQSTAEN